MPIKRFICIQYPKTGKSIKTEIYQWYLRCAIGEQGENRNNPSSVLSEGKLKQSTNIYGWPASAFTETLNCVAYELH